MRTPLWIIVVLLAGIFGMMALDRVPRRPNDLDAAVSDLKLAEAIVALSGKVRDGTATNLDHRVLDVMRFRQAEREADRMVTAAD